MSTENRINFLERDTASLIAKEEFASDKGKDQQSIDSKHGIILPLDLSFFQELRRKPLLNDLGIEEAEDLKTDASVAHYVKGEIGRGTLRLCCALVKL